MGIMKDAGELLIYIYQSYLKDESLSNIDIIESTKWESGKINRAMDYLSQIEAIKIVSFLGSEKGVQNFDIRGITPLGIQMIENSDKFKSTFGFEANLGIFKFSWNRVEK